MGDLLIGPMMVSGAIMISSIVISGAIGILAKSIDEATKTVRLKLVEMNYGKDTGHGGRTDAPDR